MRYITGTNSTNNKCKVEETMIDYYLTRGFIPDKKGAELLAKIQGELSESFEEKITTSLTENEEKKEVSEIELPQELVSE